MASGDYDHQTDTQDKNKTKRQKILRIILFVVLVLIFIIALILILGIFVFKFFHDEPVLIFKPTPSDGNSLIWYKSFDPENNRYWIKNLEEFLHDYRKEEKISYDIVQCSRFVSPAPGKACDFKVDPKILGPCSPENSFSYLDSSGGPCVFLQLKKLYGWVPEYYNSTNLPDTVPEQLKFEIVYAQARNEHQKVWVTCEGESPVDKEFMGPISYYPMRGFSSEYFPFTNQEGYLSPLVAVYFERPKHGVVITVNCTAWAKNINENQSNHGSVQFAILMDV